MIEFKRIPLEENVLINGRAHRTSAAARQIVFCSEKYVRLYLLCWTKMPDILSDLSESSIILHAAVLNGPLVMLNFAVQGHNNFACISRSFLCFCYSAPHRRQWIRWNILLVGCSLFFFHSIIKLTIACMYSYVGVLFHYI